MSQSHSHYDSSDSPSPLSQPLSHPHPLPLLSLPIGNDNDNDHNVNVHVHDHYITHDADLSLTSSFPLSTTRRGREKEKSKGSGRGHHMSMAMSMNENSYHFSPSPSHSHSRSPSHHPRVPSNSRSRSPYSSSHLHYDQNNGKHPLSMPMSMEYDILSSSVSPPISSSLPLPAHILSENQYNTMAMIHHSLLPSQGETFPSSHPSSHSQQHQHHHHMVHNNHHLPIGVYEDSSQSFRPSHFNSSPHSRHNNNYQDQPNNNNNNNIHHYPPLSSSYFPSLSSSSSQSPSHMNMMNVSMNDHYDTDGNGNGHGNHHPSSSLPAFPHSSPSHSIPISASTSTSFNSNSTNSMNSNSTPTPTPTDALINSENSISSRSRSHSSRLSFSTHSPSHSKSLSHSNSSTLKDHDQEEREYSISGKRDTERMGAEVEGEEGDDGMTNHQQINQRNAHQQGPFTGYPSHSNGISLDHCGNSPSSHQPGNHMNIIPGGTLGSGYLHGAHEKNHHNKHSAVITSPTIGKSTIASNGSSSPSSPPLPTSSSPSLTFTFTPFVSPSTPPNIFVLINLRGDFNKKRTSVQRSIFAYSQMTISQLLHSATNVSDYDSVSLSMSQNEIYQPLSPHTILENIDHIRKKLLTLSPSSSPPHVECEFSYYFSSTVKPCTRLGCANLLINRSNRRACNVCQTAGVEFHHKQILSIPLSVSSCASISSHDKSSTFHSPTPLEHQQAQVIENYLNSHHHSNSQSVSIEHWRFDAHEEGIQYLVFSDQQEAEKMFSAFNSTNNNEGYGAQSDSRKDISSSSSPLQLSSLISRVDPTCHYVIRMKSHFWMLQIKSHEQHLLSLSSSDPTNTTHHLTQPSALLLQKVKIYKKVGKPAAAAKNQNSQSTHIGNHSHMQSQHHHLTHSTPTNAYAASVHAAAVPLLASVPFSASIVSPSPSPLPSPSPSVHSQLSLATSTSNQISPSPSHTSIRRDLHQNEKQNQIRSDSNRHGHPSHIIMENDNEKDLTLRIRGNGDGHGDGAGDIKMISDGNVNFLIKVEEEQGKLNANRLHHSSVPNDLSQSPSSSSFPSLSPSTFYSSISPSTSTSPSSSSSSLSLSLPSPLSFPINVNTNVPFVSGHDSVHITQGSFHHLLSKQPVPALLNVHSQTHSQIQNQNPNMNINTISESEMNLNLNRKNDVPNTPSLIPINNNGNDDTINHISLPSNMSSPSPSIPPTTTPVVLIYRNLQSFQRDKLLHSQLLDGDNDEDGEGDGDGDQDENGGSRNSPNGHRRKHEENGNGNDGKRNDSNDPKNGNGMAKGTKRRKQLGDERTMIPIDNGDNSTHNDHLMSLIKHKMNLNSIDPHVAELIFALSKTIPPPLPHYEYSKSTDITKTRSENENITVSQQNSMFLTDSSSLRQYDIMQKLSMVMGMISFFLLFCFIFAMDFTLQTISTPSTSTSSSSSFSSSLSSSTLSSLTSTTTSHASTLPNNNNFTEWWNGNFSSFGSFPWLSGKNQNVQGINSFKVMQSHSHIMYQWANNLTMDSFGSGFVNGVSLTDSFNVSVISIRCQEASIAHKVIGDWILYTRGSFDVYTSMAPHNFIPASITPQAVCNILSSDVVIPFLYQRLCTCPISDIFLSNNMTLPSVCHHGFFPPFDPLECQQMLYDLHQLNMTSRVLASSPPTIMDQDGAQGQYNAVIIPNCTDCFFPPNITAESDGMRQSYLSEIAENPSMAEVFALNFYSVARSLHADCNRFDYIYGLNSSQTSAIAYGGMGGDNHTVTQVAAQAILTTSLDVSTVGTTTTTTPTYSLGPDQKIGDQIQPIVLLIIMMGANGMWLLISSVLLSSYNLLLRVGDHQLIRKMPSWSKLRIPNQRGNQRGIANSSPEDQEGHEKEEAEEEEEEEKYNPYSSHSHSRSYLRQGNGNGNSIEMNQR